MKKYRTLIECIKSGRSAKDIPKALSEYRRVFEKLSVTKSGVVLRNSRILVPNVLRKLIMELTHVGHQGVVKTKALIRSRVWYPGIDAQVEAMMHKCLACQANVDKPSLEPLRPS